MKANAFGRVPPPLPDVFVCCYETHSSKLPDVKTVSEFKVCQPRRAFCFLSQRVLTEGNVQSENPQTTAHNKHVSMETSSSDGCFHGLFSWLNSLWFKVFQAVKVTLMFLWCNTTIMTQTQWIYWHRYNLRARMGLTDSNELQLKENSSAFSFRNSADPVNTPQTSTCYHLYQQKHSGKQTGESEVAKLTN